jgi:hypothetical protein
LPDAREIGLGVVLVSDTVPVAEQLGATFAEPHDAVIRLDA